MVQYGASTQYKDGPIIREMVVQYGASTQYEDRPIRSEGGLVRYVCCTRSSNIARQRSNKRTVLYAASVAQQGDSAQRVLKMRTDLISEPILI